MKKRIFAIAVVLICISILASTTIAYFTEVETARNVITSGGIAVQVVEQQLVDGVTQPYPAQPIPIKPGATVSKIVSVQSTQQPAWIRVHYTVEVFDGDGKKLEISPNTLNQMILISTDQTNWIASGGWWYYPEVLRTGEITKPLFESVSFSGPNMGNAYQNCTVVITVNAQAVQQANNGTTVMEAAGWPEN